RLDWIPELGERHAQQEMRPLALRIDRERPPRIVDALGQTPGFACRARERMERIRVGRLGQGCPFIVDAGAIIVSRSGRLPDDAAAPHAWRSPTSSYRLTRCVACIGRDPTGRA